MSVRPESLRLPAAVGAVALLLAGCTVAPSGGPASKAPTTAAVPLETPSASPTPTMTTASASASASVTPTLGTTLSPAPTASGGAPSGVDTAGAIPSAGQSPSLINAPVGSTVTLGLGNAFRSDGWAQGNFQPAGAASASPMLGATVNCNTTGPELEYRFAATRGTLKISVAQDVMSVSSDNTVDFVLLADGKAVAEKPVTFKQAADLSAPLTGVTVVKVVAKTTGTCTTSSTALITKATVTG